MKIVSLTIYPPIFTSINQSSPHMSIESFINLKFPSIDSLSTVDDVISKLSISPKPSPPVTSTSDAQDLINTLKSFNQNPKDSNISQLDDLINQYGSIPALTYTRELTLQKLKLLNEKHVYVKYTAVLDLLNDFEIFQLNDINDGILTYDEKVQIVQTVFKIRDEIEKFQMLIIDNEDSRQLLNNLNLKLFEIVNSNLVEIFKSSLIHHVDKWEDHTKSLESSKLEFKLLLDLQIASDLNIKTFWALDSLISKFHNKFIYHFQGTQETNNINKPEFSFSYIIGYLRNNLHTAQSHYSSIFATSIMNKEINGSFNTWFITSTLQILKNKFNIELPIFLKNENNQLLSHFINELKKFDAQIKNEFAYIPNKDIEWFGLTNELILNNENIWNIWLQNEKDFVNFRFNEIIDMENAFLIEDDYVENGLTKPTKSSANLKNLLNGITVNYTSLPLKFQLKFLSDVQLKLINYYFDTLKNGLFALKSIKNVVVDNVSTLERICRIWCSSKYLVEIMDKWSNEIIFIKLWESLNNNAQNYQTTFFESVINNYNKDILSKIPNLIINYFERQLNRTMKEYFQDNLDWIHPNTTTTNKFEFLIQTIDSDLKFLKNTVSNKTFIEWKLLISNTIALYFEKNIALVNNFSTEGAIKLEHEVNYIFDMLNLVKSYNDYGKLISIIHVLRDGKVDQSIEYPEVDDVTLSMLLLRRK